MEYKRMTERIHGAVVVKNELGHDISFFGTTINNALNRFAELEDKIEQGTLIELPCKVGDTVYFVDKQNKIIEEFDVSAIEVTLTKYSDGSTNRIEIVEKGTGKRNFDYILFFGWIGNTVFFTREEAEKRLKEVQG